MLVSKSEFDFKVKINRDNTENYDGNILNGIKNGYGKVEYWTTRIEIGTFKDNKKHGDFKEYFDSNIRFEGQYVNDKKNGIGIEYNLFGKKMYDGIYKNGKKNGKVTEFDINTSLIKGYGYYKDDKLYDGIRRSSDYDDVFLHYSELTETERENLIQWILEDDRINWDKEALKELEEIIGNISFEEEHIDWLINKFIESNYDEKSIYGRVIGWIFDDKTIMINRYDNNVDVDEYSRGCSLMNSRFEVFTEFFSEEFGGKVSSNVKNIYFRENEIIEFTNKFIIGYAKEIFKNIDDFFINIVNMLILTSRKDDYNIYGDQICYFEDILEKISPNKKINFEEYYARNSKNIENKIDLRLLMFLDNIEEKYRFETCGEAIISAFILLYIKIIEYYSQEFLKQINLKYESILEYDLEQCIELYLKETRNNFDSYNELIFIAFLIDKRKILRKRSIVEEMLQKNGINSKTFETNILEVYKDIKNLIYKNKKEKILKNFGNNISTMKLYSVDSIRDIDIMNGYEFEKYIKELFDFIGYTSEITKKSQDQGIDIIVNVKSKKIGIQAKCYSGSVGNKAVQEVVAGLAFHGLDKGMVITNSTFTKQAIQLARANNILLWDRYKLIDKINQVNKFIIDN